MKVVKNKNTKKTKKQNEKIEARRVFSIKWDTMSQAVSTEQAYASLFLEELDKSAELANENAYLKQKIAELEKENFRLKYEEKQNQEDLRFVSTLKAEDKWWDR